MRAHESGIRHDQSVSRETLRQLEIYVDLLTKWNRTINLVSAESLLDVWQRHIDDSAQLVNLVSLATSRWADLGAGGGLPGLVVAILAREMQPALKIILVESDRRKCAFLQTVKQALLLDLSIVTERIEVCSRLECDIVSARALAPLSRLIPYAERHLTNNGKALFLKGKSYKNELSEARKSWSFTVVVHPSLTDADSVILEIGKISHAT